MAGPKGGSFYTTANGTKIYRAPDKIPLKYRGQAGGASVTTATGRTVVRAEQPHPEPVFNRL